MTRATRRLVVRLAQEDRDRIAAQRLRYDVFVRELGADSPGADHETRREYDALDAFADHLVLVDPARDADACDHVVGVYRLMTQDRAEQAGGFYSAQEFDLTPLLASGKRLVELGRSCVHPDYRRGAGMLMLWNGVADYVLARDLQVMFGAASFPGADPARHAASLAWLTAHYLAPDPLRVRAQGSSAIAIDPAQAAARDDPTALSALPPLIRAYLRLGGVVGQGAFVDAGFNTTDICLIMDTGLMSGKAVEFYTRKSPQR